MDQFRKLWGFVVEHILDPMGRLFDCFGYKDEHRLPPRTSPVQDWGYLLPDYCLFPLIPGQGEIVFSGDLEAGRLRGADGNGVREVEDTGLVEEAEFLKAWGAMFESPVELRNNRANTRIVNTRNMPSKISSLLSGDESDHAVGLPAQLQTELVQIPMEEKTDYTIGVMSMEERTISPVEDKSDHAFVLPAQLHTEVVHTPTEEKTDYTIEVISMEEQPLSPVVDKLNHALGLPAQLQTELVQIPMEEKIDYTTEEILIDERTLSLVEVNDKASDLPVEHHRESGEKAMKEKTICLFEGRAVSSGDDVIDSYTPKGLEQRSRQEIQNRCVRFEFDTSPASSQSDGIYSGESELFSPENNNGVQQAGRGHSPYPTPLVISSEMQTPFTVFASTKKVPAGAGKNAKIRSQYVFPIEMPHFTTLEEARSAVDL